MKKKYKWILAIVVLLIGFRMALPFLAENRINNALDAIEGYHGSVEDIDMHLYRGGFKVFNVLIYEEASEDPSIPLIDLRKLDFSVEWRALFNGKIVGEVYLDTLLVNFTKVKEEVEVDSTNNRSNLIEKIQKLNPIRLNIIEVKNAEINYIDPTTDPQIDVSFKQFYLKAENLGNVLEEFEELPASLKVRANSADSGRIHINAQMNVLKDPPDFNYDVKVEDLALVHYNEIFDAKANVKIQRGRFNLYSEGKAKNGDLEAYAKPLVVDLEVANADSSASILQKAFTGIVDFGADVFTNSEEDQTGTKIPIEGTFEKADPQIFQTIINFFKNAFFDAYIREIEHTIEFGQSTKKDLSNTNKDH